MRSAELTAEEEMVLNLSEKYDKEEIARLMRISPARVRHLFGQIWLKKRKGLLTSDK